MNRVEEMLDNILQIKKERGEIKFSDLSKHLTNSLFDKQAVVLHYLQTRGQQNRTTYSARTKKILPSKVFNFLKKQTIKWDIPFPPQPAPEFTFIDLFAGIGGMRIAFQQYRETNIEGDSHILKTLGTTKCFSNFGQNPYKC